MNIPKVGDKIKVSTHFGNKLFVVDDITDKSLKLKKNSFSFEIPKERLNFIKKSWRGANFNYVSFN